MSVGRQDRVQKLLFEHLPKRFIIYVIMVFLTVYLSYVVFIYVMHMYSIIFQAICHENAPNIGCDAIRIL